MANLLRLTSAKFYQNRAIFIEDMTQTFWLTFFWDTVYVQEFHIESVEY